MSNASLLVIDDEQHLITSIARLFTDDSITIMKAANGKEGLKKVMSEQPDVVVVDYKMPEMDGLEFIKAVKAVRPELPVIVMTAHGDKDTAVHFLKEGAYRYLEKPFESDEFRLMVLDAVKQHHLLVENEKLHQMVHLNDRFGEIVGESPPMKTLFDFINKVAKTDITVLIQGESGTGKELVAKAIHDHSSRASRPFIRFNCAALPETLIESELFGHEKGAFTGAEKRKLGRFELAHQGTIFLDEIGELDLNMQVKLLRILQEKELERIGGIETVKVDVRIIAATNRDLEAMIAEKTFREDLYYRLNYFPISVPPLRERGQDILLLATYFLKKYAKEYHRNVTGFTEEAIDVLLHYSWKGNVRELQNIIARAVILSSDPRIGPDILSIGRSGQLSQVEKAVNQMLTEDELVRLYAREIYRKCDYNKKETAKVLNINFRTLNSRLQ